MTIIIAPIYERPEMQHARSELNGRHFAMPHMAPKISGDLVWKLDLVTGPALHCAHIDP